VDRLEALELRLGVGRGQPALGDLGLLAVAAVLDLAAQGGHLAAPGNADRTVQRGQRRRQWNSRGPAAIAAT
jgi:hypothetical protein